MQGILICFARLRKNRYPTIQQQIRKDIDVSEIFLWGFEEEAIERRTKTILRQSDEPSTEVSVVKIKRLLYSIFYTQDDAYIDNLLVNCRKASKYLLGDVEDESTPAFIDRFIFNAITLIFKDEEKVAKFHTSKLKYKLFLKLGKKP